jgi:uncharacterized protein (DUF1810 family)
MASESDPYDLKRFVLAQERCYASALAEIRRGEKETHWMWFVFPQLAGLGRSATSQHYGLRDLGEAAAYLRHPLLGARLTECFRAAISVQARSARDLFSSPDDLKFHSSATLFACVTPGDPVFQQVLDRYFQGRRDGATLRLLGPLV